MSLPQRFFSEAFRDMQRAMTAFDQSFYNTARRSVVGSPSSLLNQNIFNNNLFRYPAADMAETADAYELSAELPGYDKKNIKIELADSRTLVLSGSVNEQREAASKATDAVKNEAVKDEAVKDETVKDETVKDEATKVEAAAPEGQVVKKDENAEQVIKQEPQYWVKERVSGSFSRSFSFPEPINPDTIKASFENGVLKVTIPKSAEKQAKKISIE